METLGGDKLPEDLLLAAETRPTKRGIPLGAKAVKVGRVEIPTIQLNKNKNNN